MTQMIFDKYTEEEHQIRKQLNLQNEEMAELNYIPENYPFTMQSMVAKEEKHFFWLDLDNIKQKFMKRMTDDTRTIG